MYFVFGYDVYNNYFIVDFAKLEDAENYKAGKIALKVKSVVIEKI